MLSASAPVVLSFFDRTGTWSAPYRDAGYRVVQVDIANGFDILTLTSAALSRMGLLGCKVQGVLAAPPCTDFSCSGATWWKAKDRDGRTAYSVSLVTQTLALIQVLQPVWWVLENPKGRLPRMVPELKKFGPLYIDPCDYGGWMQPGEKSIDWHAMPERDAYTKKTALFGIFHPPVQRPVQPVYITASNGKRYSPVHWYSGSKQNRQELRSVTPKGFSRAFFAANP